MYADVIVNISSENVDKPYQYLVPDTLADKVRPGCPVVIPFGSRTINGYVIDLSEKPQIDPARQAETPMINRESSAEKTAVTMEIMY